MTIRRTVYISLTSLFAAIYAVSVVTLTPISFGILQFRVADALLPIAILFGWPAILGLSMGAFISNFFGSLGLIDILGGTAANFLGTFIAWRIGQRRFKGSWLVAIISEIVLVTAIVGSYLSVLFNTPWEVGLSGVFLGSLVSIGILGTILFIVISRHAILGQLESHGLTTPRGKSKD